MFAENIFQGMQRKIFCKNFNTQKDKFYNIYPKAIE